MEKYQEALDNINKYAYDYKLKNSLDTLQELIYNYEELKEKLGEKNGK